MADMQQLERALVNADKAGDVEAARTIAGEIKRQRAMAQPDYSGQVSNAGAKGNKRGVTRADAIAFGGAQGLTLGTSDEIEAGLRTGAGLWGDYGKTLGEVRSNMKAAQEAYPVSSVVAEILGAVALGKWASGAGLTLTGKAATIPRAIGYGAAEGAGWGGLYGAGTGEGVGGRAQNALMGMAFGGPIGAATAAGGLLVDKVLGRIKPSASAEAQKAVDRAREFDIPLSRGQATGNVGRQSFEEAAAHDVYGQWPGQTIRDFRGRQSEAVANAGKDIAGRMGGGGGSPYDVALGIKSSVAGRAAAYKDAAHKAYDAAERGNASVMSQAFPSLKDKVGMALDGEIIPDTYGTLRAVVGKIDDLAGLANAPKGTIGVNWKEVERVRRGIISAKTADPGENRLLRKAVGAFDDWFGETIDTAMLSGDKATLDALKKARGLWSQYRALSAGKGGDADRLLGKIVSGEATDGEVANALFGVSKIGAKGQSVRLVNRLKKEFGANSPEIAAIRQAAFEKALDRVTGTGMKGYGSMATALDEMLSKSGREFAGSLFTPQQIAEMMRFRDVVGKLPMAPEAMNPPKSGFTASRLARAAFGNLLAVFGYDVGGIAGAGIGAAVVPVATAARTIQAGRAISRPVPKVGRPVPASLAGLVSSDERAQNAAIGLGRTAYDAIP